MMKTQILLLLLILPILLPAQNSAWGIGVLSLPYDSNGKINVYDAPNGKTEGSLGVEENIYAPGTRTIIWRDGKFGGPRMHIPDEAVISIGYEIQGLIVHEERDGHLKIMYREGEIISWIAIEELQKEGFIYQPWISFMSDPNRTFFTMSYGMNIREQPNINATRILTVKGDQFEIEPTGKTKGLWAEVVIKEYNSVYCEEPHHLIKTYHGWMKILDDEGFPNVWFYPKGC